jgi:hypothetical protein
MVVGSIQNAYVKGDELAGAAAEIENAGIWIWSVNPCPSWDALDRFCSSWKDWEREKYRTKLSTYHLEDPDKCIICLSIYTQLPHSSNFLLFNTIWKNFWFFISKIS